jgi:N-methylhydantoinase B
MTEIWLEGICVTPIKLHDRGELRQGAHSLTMFAARKTSRESSGRDWVRPGRSTAVTELVGEYGTLSRSQWTTSLTSAEQARPCIVGWSDGVHKGQSILDDDGHGIENIPIHATVAKTDDEIVVDLSESDDQVIWIVNSFSPMLWVVRTRSSAGLVRSSLSRTTENHNLCGAPSVLCSTVG